jgi:pheromone shutdown protein TraB
MVSFSGFSAVLLAVLTASLGQAFTLPPSSATSLLQQQPHHHAPAPLLTTPGIAKAATVLGATQLLELIEPETGVTVKLVGAMHYNPTSIALATDTIEALAQDDMLGSVIIESCDIRWKSSQNSSIILQRLLQSEMRAACDVAQAYNRPVVLGDQRINITVDKMKVALKETLGDLVRPPMGWQRIVGNITGAWQEAAAPANGDEAYLTPVAFLDPRLLLAAPVSFFKYPFSYLVKSPVQTIAVLSLLFLTDLTGSATSPEELGVVDYAASLSFALLEVAVFARIILKEILAERNVILADSILEQCRIYQKQQNSGWFGTSFGQSSKQATAAGSEIVYVPNTNKDDGIKILSGNDGKTVVAVLGMAHCNGIKKLLLKE